MINHIFMKQRIALAGGVIASIVTGMMGIAVYSSANPGAFGCKGMDMPRLWGEA